MAKKVLVFFIVLLFLFLCFAVMQGALYGGKFSLSLYDGGGKVISKNYNIKFSTMVTVRLKYGGNFLSYYEAHKSSAEALSRINPSLKGDLDNAAKSIDKPMTPASVVWDGGEFSYLDGTPGVFVDQEKLYRAVFSSFGKEIKINVEKENIPPSPNIDELKMQTVKIAEFSTFYASSSYERKHNIRLAAEYLKGSFVLPGQTFSFNAAVGDRTKERGFMTAHIIENGKFVDGVGGGVCQVSTTLYNAVLLAGVRVDSARSHSLPVSYVPLSFDAMVSSRSDMTFTNVSDYTLYIKAAADDSRLVFTVYGYPPVCTVKTRSVTVKTIPGQEYETVEDWTLIQEGLYEKIIKAPKDGFVSEGYLDYYKDGSLLESVRIRKDTYLPQKGIKAVRPALQGETEDAA